MAKADRLFFENLIESAEYACQAADYLVSCLSDYQPANVKTMLDTMHEFEHAGDHKKHEMAEMLAKAFVTPIDREDLDLLSQNIDDVTDSIEEILQAFYMYKITSGTQDAITFAKKIAACCRLMKQVLEEFINFKKPEKLHNLIVELNSLEEECDVLYIDSTMRLNDAFSDALTVISWREIYNRMENCADSCEHIGDCIDTVVMKNS